MNSKTVEIASCATHIIGMMPIGAPRATFFSLKSNIYPGHPERWQLPGLGRKITVPQIDVHSEQLKDIR